MPDSSVNNPSSAHQAPNPAPAPPAEAAVGGDHATPVPHDPYAALRFPGYRNYSIGWLFATIAYQMQSTAIGWELFRWTHSEMHLGLYAGIQAIPLLLLALPAGRVADLYDRKRIAVMGAILSALCALGLAILCWAAARHRIPISSAIPLLYGLVFMGAIVNTFTHPARAALLPQIVPARVFSNAVTWNSSIFEVSSMSGPALAGLIIWYTHAATVFGLAALFQLFFFGFLLLVRRPPFSPAKPTTNKGQLTAGLRFVWNTKIILATISLDLFAVLLGGATYLLPSFASHLGVGAVGFGWMRAAPAVGALSMAMVLAHRPPLKHAGKAMLLAVAGFGLATVVFGLSHWFWLSLVALCAAGACDNISVVVRHTLVQLLTPDNMRGRVSAVNAVFIGSSNELGGLESGLTAAWFGIVGSVVGGGIGTILVVIAVALIWPEVRRYGSLQDARPEETAP